MHPRALVAMIIFIASYLPLAVILLIQDLDLRIAARGLCPVWRGPCASPLKHTELSLGFVLLSSLCLVATLGALALLKPKQQIKVVEARHVPADLMNYVLPYVVSFTGLDFSDLPKLLGFAVFLAWIFLITLRSGQVIMNPVLTVFGWQLYELSYQFHGGSADAHAASALARRSLETGDVVAQQSLQTVMIIK